MNQRLIAILPCNDLAIWTRRRLSPGSGLTPATLRGRYAAAAPAVCSVERSSFTPGPIVDETEARRR